MFSFCALKFGWTPEQVGELTYDQINLLFKGVVQIECPEENQQRNTPSRSQPGNLRYEGPDADKVRQLGNSGGRVSRR